MTRVDEGNAVRHEELKIGQRLPPPLSVSLDDVPLDTIAMPPLRRIVNREVTPEELDRARVLDALQRVKQWKTASVRERGEAIADLLNLVSAMNRFPPQRTEFPGFPGSPKRRRARR